MKLQAIIKGITIKNSDVDQYLTLKLEVSIDGVDLTKLNELHHKALTVDIKAE